ncbi:MAG TPA: carboxypeptidase-like regulatory domain-containing protein [Bacteroidota bacterium]|nr:carboxypeptidase-like regulatory domain-containing protein [Bacteroidota bacterium]
MVISLSLLLCACSDAPRDNPLDPQSPRYQGNAMVGGNVYVLDQNSPVGQARVTCVENGLSVLTDSNGVFQFTKIDVGSLTFVCTKTGFAPDTSKIVLQAGSPQQISFGLNGYPYIVSQRILTRKIDQYYPSPQYFVDVSASVSDPNGIEDVDSVWFVVDSTRFVMVYSPTTNMFQTTIYKYSFPTNTIQWLVGKPLTIESTDRSRALGVGSPFYVTRIIEDEATPVYPSSLNNDTTGSLPMLKWTPPNVTYNFSYTLVISLVNSGTEQVWWTYSGYGSIYQQLQFPSDSTTQPLQAGNYVWTIAVVDDFGNYSRSKESSFVVK